MCAAHERPRSLCLSRRRTAKHTMSSNLWNTPRNGLRHDQRAVPRNARYSNMRSQLKCATGD